MNDKMYIPNGLTCACADLINKDTLRCYTQRPSRPSSSSGGYYTYQYYDIYFTSHYHYSIGNSNFYYNSTLPSCSYNSRLTNDFYYRYDFDSSLIIFLILTIFVVFIPYKVFSRMFGRWLKV